MTKEHLIPLGQPGNEEYDKKVRSKLKGSGSDKRKIAQQIAGLKKANPETIEQKALKLATSPKISSLEIMRMIQVLKERKDLPESLQVMLIGKAIDAHKAIFGTKSFNVNMDVNPKSSKSIHEIYLEVQNERNGQTESEDDDREGDIEESSEGEERKISS